MITCKRTFIFIFLYIAASRGELFFPNLINYQAIADTPVSKTHIPCMIQGIDGGFVLAGQSVNNHFLLKFDSAGKKEWTYIPDYTRSYSVNSSSVNITRDNCYIFASINHKTIAVNNFEESYRLTKLNSSGELEWEQLYPCNYKDDLQHVVELADGGFLIAGNVNRPGTGYYDMQFYRTDREGKLLSKKMIILEEGYSTVSRMQGMPDGTVLVLATKYESVVRTWFIKLNSEGDTLWSKSLYYHSQNRLNTICPTKDGNYICGGNSTSYDGKNLFWVVKIDSSCNIIWSKNYFVNDNTTIASIASLNDGTYAFAGQTPKNCILMKINGNGDSLLTIRYKSLLPHFPSSIVATSEGRCAIAGTISTSSNDYNAGFFLQFESESKSTDYACYRNWEVMGKVAPYDNCVVKATIDSSNRLWVGLRMHIIDGPAVYCLNNGSWQENPDIPKQQITSMVTSSSGIVWICGDLGIYRVSEQKTTLFTFNVLNPQSSKIYPLGADSAFVLGEFGLCLINGDTKTLLPTDTFPEAAGDAYSLYIDIKSTFWYASSNGLVVKNDSDYSIHIYKNAPLPFLRVNNMYPDFSGNFYLASNKGLVTISNDEWSIFDSTNSALPSNLIRASALTHDGKILAGTNSGFVDINAKKIYNYNNSPLPSDIVNCIVIDRNNNAYIGTDSGLVKISIQDNQLPALSHNYRVSTHENSKHAKTILTNVNSVTFIPTADRKSSYFNLLGRTFSPQKNTQTNIHCSSNIIIQKNNVLSDKK